MPFLRIKKFKRKKDQKPRIYFYIVESKRKNDKVQQKVIRYLGTAENILKTYKEFDQLKKTSKLNH